MNEEIIELLKDMVVNGESIPVKLLFYNGHGESYITFQEEDADESLSGDDQLLGFVTYYDIDVYTRANLNAIVNEVKRRMVVNGDWVWQVARSSQMMFDPTTGYYHQTLSFAKERMNLEWQK